MYVTFYFLFHLNSLLQKGSGDSDYEWVEVTDKMRIKEAEREAKEAEELPGPVIPEHLLAGNSNSYTTKAK